MHIDSGFDRALRTSGGLKPPPAAAGLANGTPQELDRHRGMRIATLASAGWAARPIRGRPPAGCAGPPGWWGGAVRAPLKATRAVLLRSRPAWRCEFAAHNTVPPVLLNHHIMHHHLHFLIRASRSSMSQQQLSSSTIHLHARRSALRSSTPKHSASQRVGSCVGAVGADSTKATSGDVPVATRTCALTQAWSACRGVVSVWVVSTCVTRAWTSTTGDVARVGTSRTRSGYWCAATSVLHERRIRVRGGCRRIIRWASTTAQQPPTCCWRRGVRVNGIRWVLGYHAFPRGPDPGVLEHCRGPVWPTGVPLGPLHMSWHMSWGGGGGGGGHNPGARRGGSKDRRSFTPPPPWPPPGARGAGRSPIATPRHCLSAQAPTQGGAAVQGHLLPPPLFRRE
jgi:hypothetical protein